jgi:hypothetical protein
VNYKITDKRVSVTSTSPLNSEQLDASYAQMKEVRAIGRGIGLWGDMVIVLNDGAKVEIRCIDRCVAAVPARLSRAGMQQCRTTLARVADAPSASMAHAFSLRRWQEIKAYIEAQIEVANAAKEAGYTARNKARAAAKPQ